MAEKLFFKLKRCRGESLAETLIATLIAAMAMVILAGALVSASKANKAAEDMSSFAMDTKKEENVGVAFKQGSDTKTYTVDMYSKDQEDGQETRKVYYYEIHE